ncbi:FKBP-type peptidyl-prolyl cis-trans isomerase [uncultured Cytophaga sp.]|uniref:FKBP-type peptidyl-prolyl cis-trans isomerase n=1 Tax=uncultured Cytophaga sp. TaxID=160238 RepID=UPI002602C1ED|nr:FKBP-type peptidyl-prolyl cis-trans isomerase [uncultured Cytophaga sp.]
MNRILLLIVLIGFISMHAEAQKKTKTPSKATLFKEKDVAYAPSGLAYKYRLDVPGKPGNLSDVVELDFTLYNNKDSVLRSTVAEKNRVITTVQKPKYPGAFEEAIAMLSKGDSCAFWLSADTLFKLGIGAEMPPYIEKGSFVRFEVKMHDIMTMDEYNKKQVVMAKQTQVEEDAKLASYIKTNNIKATLDTATGIYYQVVQEGPGAKPKAGNKVIVHYTGQLLNGEIFDSSKDRNEPFDFILGKGYVIEGWDEGIPLMHKGEKGILYIPSYRGYGAQRAGSIPPNSSLIFEVELLDIK